MIEYGSVNIDYSDIDSVLNDIIGDGRSFGDYVGSMMDGNVLSYDDIYNNICGILSGEIDSIRSMVGNMLLIILIAAVFINLAGTIGSRQISENGFYVTYMLLFILLSVSFGRLDGLAAAVMDNLINFISVLLPTFFMTVTYVAGGTVILYQSAMAVIGIVEIILGKIFLPVVKAYFVLAMINPLLNGNYFTKFLELIEQFVIWGLKGLFILVSGIGLMQGMIIPAATGMKKGMVGRIIKSIPGAGNTMNTVMESVYGTGVLLKNAVGVAGLVIIIAICSIPVLKIGAYYLIYQFGAAVSEPVSADRRLIDCISAAAGAARLLLMIVFMSAMLFMVTIGIVTAATGLTV